jgi:hypothetical protein
MLTMNIEARHLNALQTLGYTGAEARFHYIVATYSGYFRARQFLAFHDAHWVKRDTLLWSKLERQKHACIERYPKTGATYHLFSRRLYRLIEKENLRNRRIHELDFIKHRMAILDFVLANLEYEYLETEPQKVSYFCEKLAADRRYVPARLYLSRDTSRSSVRYFVDEFPMFLPSWSPVVTFTHLHDGMNGSSDFVQHLETYLPLFRQLSEFRVLYVSRTDLQFEKAIELFDLLVRIPLEFDITEDVLRYFRIRKAWDGRQYGTVSDAGLIYRNQAHGRFKGETFEELYRNWKYGQVSSAGSEERFQRNERWRSIRFRTYQLGPIQVPGRDSEESGAEGKTCALQACNWRVLHPGKIGSSSNSRK